MVEPFTKSSAAVRPLLTIAIVACATALIGWVIDDPVIAGFGNADLLMQPWTGLACIALSVAFWAAAAGHCRSARALAVVPLLIGMATIAREWMVLPPQIDALIFAEYVQTQARVPSGRPALITAFAIILLSAATLATASRSIAGRRIITAASCVAIAITLISGGLVPLGLQQLSPGGRWIFVSVPATIALIAIAFAILAHRRVTAWPRNPQTSLDGKALQWALIVLTLIPAVSALWQISTFGPDSVAAIAKEIAQAAFIVTASSIITAWVWYRLVNERAARWAFNGALDATPLVLTDLDGRIIRWSKGCEALYGWPAKEARGQHKHSLTGAALASGKDLCATPDIPQEIEITERHRDGSRLRIIERRQIVRPQPDVAPMMMISITDITERHRSEQAKLASEARLAFAADLHELGLFEWSQTPDEVRLSPQAARLFGYPADAPIGTLAQWRQQLLETFGQDILPDKPLASLSSDRHPFRLSCQRSQSSILEGSIFFYQRPGVEGLSMLGIVMDVTEKERITEGLRTQKLKLRAILETVPEAMITLNADGCVRSFSAPAEQLLGYDSEAITGQDIRVILPDYPPVSGRAKVTVARHRQGQDLPVEVVVSQAFIGGENISIVFMRSLSEQIAAENRLNELREQLLHSSRVSSMGEMGAGLAHELNQPLSATANFLGAADVHLSTMSDPEAKAEKARQLVGMARSEVLRASEIIRRMRNFVSRGMPDMRAFSLADLIDDAVQLAQPSIRRAGVTLQYQGVPSGCDVYVDHIQMQQVLVNLISNALQAFATRGTDEPTISISAEMQTDASVLVRVTDNGPGFPASIIKKPFTAFTSTQQKGMGLGLVICRRIVEAHGGKLSISNAASGGAVVDLTLPSHRQQGGVNTETQV